MWSTNFQFIFGWLLFIPGVFYVKYIIGWFYFVFRFFYNVFRWFHYNIHYTLHYIVYYVLQLCKYGITETPTDQVKREVLYNIRTGGRNITVFADGRTDYRLPEESFFEHIYYDWEIDEWPWMKILCALCVVAFLFVYEKSPKFRYWFTIITLPVVYYMALGLCNLYNYIFVPFLLWLATAIDGLGPALWNFVVMILDGLYEYVHKRDATDSLNEGEVQGSYLAPDTPVSPFKNKRLGGGELIASSIGHPCGFIGSRKLTPFSPAYLRVRAENGILSEVDKIVLQVREMEIHLAEKARSEAEANRHLNSFLGRSRNLAMDASITWGNELVPIGTSY